MKPPSINLLKPVWLISLLFFLFFIPLSAVELLTMKGESIQGGFLIGAVPEEIEKLFWNYQEIDISKDFFIRGFDRDEELRQVITLVEKSGEMHHLTIRLTRAEYEIQDVKGISTQYSHKPTNPEVTSRINRETLLLQEARQIINNNQFRYFDEFIRPIDGGRVTSLFGSQRIINGIVQRPHNGIDIAVPEGTEIKAMTSGVVVLTGDYYYNGKFVLIDHGVGLSSIYLHMNQIAVEAGNYVKTGSKIGEVGTTGRSSGNHLHWGVNWYKNRINPQSLLKLDEVFFTLIKGDN